MMQLSLRRIALTTRPPICEPLHRPRSGFSVRPFWIRLPHHRSGSPALDPPSVLVPQRTWKFTGKSNGKSVELTESSRNVCGHRSSSPFRAKFLRHLFQSNTWSEIDGICVFKTFFFFGVTFLFDSGSEVSAQTQAVLSALCRQTISHLCSPIRMYVDSNPR